MKEKSKVIERLRKKLTPERLSEMKEKRLEEKNKLSSEFQFGYFVGEHIYHTILPTLSVEAGTRNVIAVSLDDETEYKRLDNDWYVKCQHGKNEVDEEWRKYQQCRKKLLKKYLPNPLQCYLQIINIWDMKEFKAGLINSLWNCDVCSYSLKSEDIKIYDDKDSYFTIIELKLDEDEN